MRTRTFLTALLWITACYAAAPSIGTVSGNTAITDGTRLETADSVRDVNLANGVDIRLSPQSAGTVFNGRLVVDQGAARIGNFEGYTVEVGRYQVQAEDSTAEAVVRLAGKRIEVASVRGSLSVTESGAMLTKVLAGTRVSFQQTGSGQRHKRRSSDRHILLWVIGLSAVAALAIGLTAAAQGKSPF